MIFNTWGQAIGDSFLTLWPGVIQLGVALLVAIVIFIIGWVVGSLVGTLIEKLFQTAKVDTALRQAGVESALHRGGITLNSGAFIGGLIKWFIIAVFFLASLQVLGLEPVTLFLQTIIVSYLPRVIIAVLILVVSIVIADAVKKVVSASAAAANIHSAKALGTIAKAAIIVFAVFAAFLQLDIAPAFFQTVLMGIVVAFALAFGLAFGLGGRDAAARLIQKAENEVYTHRQ
ncbi:MAG: hypothetical protein V4664_02860 [Patescibacteria group bacterium]